MWFLCVHYELMVILDPNLDERTVAPSLDTFLERCPQGRRIKIDKVDIWGKRRLAYEIQKHTEGDLRRHRSSTRSPQTVSELDRQLKPERVGAAHQGSAHRQSTRTSDDDATSSATARRNSFESDGTDPG